MTCFDHLIPFIDGESSNRKPFQGTQKESKASELIKLRGECFHPFIPASSLDEFGMLDKMPPWNNIPCSGNEFESKCCT